MHLVCFALMCRWFLGTLDKQRHIPRYTAVTSRRIRCFSHVNSMNKVLFEQTLWPDSCQKQAEVTDTSRTFPHRHTLCSDSLKLRDSRCRYTVLLYPHSRLVWFQRTPRVSLSSTCAQRSYNIDARDAKSTHLCLRGDVWIVSELGQTDAAVPHFLQMEKILHQFCFLFFFSYFPDIHIPPSADGVCNT